MKKFLIAVLFVSALSLKFADAQISIKLNLNIGSQPDWGPTGYDHVDYYYLPDIGCYYDVPNHQYIYRQGNTWARNTTLPPQYKNYDVYKGYKVVVNSPKPYLHDNVYRSKYASYKGHQSPPVIRDSHDAKYQHRQNDQHGRPGNDQHGKPGNDHRDDHKDDHRGDHH